MIAWIHSPEGRTPSIGTDGGEISAMRAHVGRLTGGGVTVPGDGASRRTDGNEGGWCNITNAVAGAWEIAVAQDLIAWDAAAGREFRCGPPGPWQYNWGPSHQVWTSFAWGSKPCNSQWYRGDGFAAVWLRTIYAGAERPPVKTGWVFFPER